MENAPGSKFCRECATPLSAEAGGQAGAGGKPSFTRTMETPADYELRS